MADTRAGIRHPNVVRAHTVDLEEGRLRLALEQHRAPTLAQRLEQGPLDPLEAARLVKGLADAYHSLAEDGLTAHRFTPDGVLIDPDHGGVLADSGVPPELVRGSWLESDPDLVFRSPEELRRQPVRACSAVYSLGALLYTALTGEPPYAGAPSEVYATHFIGPRPRPTTRRPELPRAIDAVVARAMAVEPGDRYTTPADLASAAAAALAATSSSESPAGSATATRATTPATRRPTRRPAAAGARAPARTARANRSVERKRKPGTAPAPAAPAKRSPDRKRKPGTTRPAVTRTRRLWLLAGAAAIACALLGVLLASTSAEDSSEPPARISARGLSVRPPTGWERAPAGRDAPFTLPGLLSARPAGGSDAGLVLGTVRSQAALEPFFAYAGGDDIAREAVRVGSLTAWRYHGLRSGTDGVATAYLAPTTGGMLVVVCHAARRQLLRKCNQAVGTVKLEGAQPRPLTSLDPGGERLVQVMGTLAARRSRARERLADAELARGQAEAARALRWSYERAAKALAWRSPLEPVGSFDELSASLRRTAAAYAGVARAAQRSQSSRYQAAVRAVGRQERAVYRTLAEARTTRP